MNTVQDNQNSKIKEKNTFSTDSSKLDTDNDPDQNFKNQRQKYLEQRLNRRQQIKKIRKQQFGSSSSESDKSVQKFKPKPKIVKDFEVVKIQGNQVQKIKNEQQQFHSKHQAYIKQKLLRKRQLIQQRKKQFGSSSSESDQQLSSNNKVETVKNEQMMIKQQQVHQQITIELPKQKLMAKRSIEIQNNQNNNNVSPIIVQQIVYSKGQKNQQAKKLTILVQSKKNLQWIEQTLVIQNKRIKFINQNLQFMIAYVTKIKLFFTKVMKDFFKIKITYKDDDYFFAVSNSKKIDNIDQYYYVFSRIIQQKLQQIGFQPKKNQASIFPNYMNLKDAPIHLKNGAMIYGNILKKSQILGNWELRFVYITDKQIGSSKKPNDKPSMIIQADSISQLWSRFDIQNNNLLNIKIMYNNGTKTQFGIPMSNFTDEYNWLYCFYKIINKRD